MRVMRPIYVEPTPWWAYATWTCLGAVLALLLAAVVVRWLNRRAAAIDSA